MTIYETLRAIAGADIDDAFKPGGILPAKPPKHCRPASVPLAAGPFKMEVRTHTAGAECEAVTSPGADPSYVVVTDDGATLHLSDGTRTAAIPLQVQRWNPLLARVYGCENGDCNCRWFVVELIGPRMPSRALAGSAAR